ncbi:MAG: LptF/LptG family permease [Elusimicrobia bacterium]|nr:LptF/LptG family permease [Elusimicrobiota bacterium]
MRLCRYSFLYDRFLLKELILQMILWSSFFTVLFILSVFLEKLDGFISNKAAPLSVLIYLGKQAPFWIWKASPLAFLGASLAVLDNANRAGELTALESLGMAPSRIYAPIFALSIFLTLLGEAGLESGAPRFYRESKIYLRTAIYKRVKRQGPIQNFSAKGGQGRYFAFGLLNPEKKDFKNFWMDEWDGQAHRREIFAKQGYYDDLRGLWVLEQAAERTFLDTSLGLENRALEKAATRVVPRLLLNIADTPQSLLPAAWKTDEMTMPEIKENLAILRQRGIAHRNLLTEYHCRLAWPVSFLIMAIAASTVLRAMPKKIFKGKLVLFGITIVVGLAYWFSVNLSKTLASHGLVEPVWAAWAPHAGFIVLAKISRLLRS